MSFNNCLDEICFMLTQYGGRDKVIRTLCYASKLVSTMSSDAEQAKKFAIFASKMSQTRATLRLFDDLPMLQATLGYGLGRHEPDRTMSLLGVLGNIIDTTFFPVDKICWLSEHKIIKLKNQNFWETLSSLFWLASVYISLVRLLRMRSLRDSHVKVVGQLDFQKYQLKEIIEQVTIVRNLLDILHAGSGLPKGMLWGGKLQTWQVALVGTASSLLGMYQFLAKRRLNK